jgi:hypothetical protein
MADQREFARWWRGNVTNAQNGAFAEAELATGISHQQVSRWAKPTASDTTKA